MNLSEKTLISLCMIVKNEESNLSRCLDSVKDIVDEMVIVDTGSTDRTKEIALSYDAKVYDFEWIDDFAAARNYGIDRATGEWILVLDADEWLDADVAYHLRNLLTTSKYDAYKIIQRNYFSGRIQNVVDSETIRIFRNRLAYRYKRVYHEYVDESLKKHKAKIKSDPSLIIHHDGYMHADAQGSSRQERAVRHLQYLVEINPSSSFAWCKLGVSQYRLGLHEKAYQTLSRFITMPYSRDCNPLDTQVAIVCLADLAIRKGDYSLALRCGKAGRMLKADKDMSLISEMAYAIGLIGEAVQFAKVSALKKNKIKDTLQFLENAKAILQKLLETDGFENKHQIILSWLEKCEETKAYLTTHTKNKSTDGYQYSHR